MLDKAAFLDALGVKRWRPSTPMGERLVILVDSGDHLQGDHPLISSILRLVDCENATVDIQENYSRDMTVFWDMRARKLPKASCVLSSPPLSKLQQESHAKRALWQQIYER
ncbi:DNA polymerase III subunit psi [Shewanella waksmanii]|uniref:DNA polymerase III subunit psi n=1 Tax=Shewanella waksmanii TaxID=213783 RepID=UPI003736A5C3